MPTGTFGATFDILPQPHGFSDPEFLVVGIDGEEEISRPYRFEFDLTCTDPNVDLAALIHLPVSVTLEFDYRRQIQGIIGAIEMCGQAWPGVYRYRAVVIPTMAKLAMSMQSQIYGTVGEVSALDIVETELTGRGARGTAENSAVHVKAENIEFRLPRDIYPRRNYVVQYRESDLDFMNRLLEHYGIFYFFNHANERELICFGDSNAAFDKLSADGHMGTPRTVEFRPPSESGAMGETSVHELTYRRNPMPNSLVLREHNYRNPLGPLRQPDYLHAERTVDPDGHGVIVLEAEHFRDASGEFSEGEMLARARAQELLSRQDLFSGSSDCYQFCAGSIFELSGHDTVACNQSLLITHVRHRAGERLPDDGPAYVNEFTAIPATTPYRPPRRTPKPQVNGLLYAHVDAGGIGKRAEIDSEGRYKIRIPFDLSGSNRGVASRYVRMAQPYSGFSAPGGSGTGMHFPLMKGTELIIACVNGDPDRPIIVGTVPNPKTRTPVTQENRTKNQVRTASGILMEFEDG